jgi:hypothetical protein
VSRKWSSTVQHGPARPACGTLRDLAGPLLDHAGHLRACECRANGPAWSSMVPHVQHAGPCGTLLDIAGHCGTMLDHLRGTRGMIGRSRMTDRCTIQKRGLRFGNWGATPTITASSCRWLMDLCVECSASACVRMSPSMKILPVALHGYCYVYDSFSYY